MIDPAVACGQAFILSLAAPLPCSRLHLPGGMDAKAEATDRSSLQGTQPGAINAGLADSLPSRRTGVAPALTAVRLLLLLLSLALLSQFLVIVPAGHQGVLLRFGAVQPQALGEGLHPILPVRDRVVPVSLRLQSLRLHSEAASRDLQDVGFDVAVSWQLDPGALPDSYRQLGDQARIEAALIEPALEDGLKLVVAGFRADELISQRQRLKDELGLGLVERLRPHHITLAAVDLLQLDFSKRFRQAVEAKQVAEQDARRADYEAMKAQKLASARVYLAEGEARALQLTQQALTPEILRYAAIEKWNGHLPLVIGQQDLALDIRSLLKADQRASRKQRFGSPAALSRLPSSPGSPPDPAPGNAPPPS